MVLRLFAGMHISNPEFPLPRVAFGESGFCAVSPARSVHTAAASAGYKPERRFLTSCNIARRI